MENQIQTIKWSLFTYAVALVAAFSATANAGTYADVWETTKQGPYNKLPSHPTTKASFFSNGINLLAKAANRTLNDDADTLPYFQKLVHPIGVCFAGTWTIDQPSQYSGYFAQGSQGLIIMRASEAVGQPLQGDYRAFGLAGKLFPTNDPKDARNYKTANFFTVDDLGGTMSNAFLDLPKTNAPPSSFHPSTVLSLPMIGAILSAFKAADSNPGVRQLYQVSELGIDNPSGTITPKGFKLTADTRSLGKNAAKDFRNEMRVQNYMGQTISFGINVSSQTDGVYQRIGTIELKEDALSEGCDHLLHFQHPRWRN